MRYRDACGCWLVLCGFAGFSLGLGFRTWVFGLGFRSGTGLTGLDESMGSRLSVTILHALFARTRYEG